jgi:hypothetical protein
MAPAPLHPIYNSTPSSQRPPAHNAHRMQRYSALAVLPSSCGATLRIMMAPGALHASDRANPASRALKEPPGLSASRLWAMKGAASKLAPAEGWEGEARNQGGDSESRLKLQKGDTKGHN